MPRRWFEAALLVAGLIALDTYVWVQVDQSVSEAYDGWALDSQIRGEHPSFSRFVLEELGLSKPSIDDNRVAKARDERIEIKPQPRLARMALVGRVEIPRLGLNAVVREGTDDGVLRTAVGHMPSTALPGYPGNVAIAAHRDTLFQRLQGIQKDDHVTLEAADGKTYEYVVESMTIVKPNDVSVLRAKPNDRLLTLITCYPFNYIGSAPNRFIVKARQVNAIANSGRRETQRGS